MADTWPKGDPSEDDGWFGTIKGAAIGIANAVGGGAANGFGLGDASSGMAGGAAETGSTVKPSVVEPDWYTRALNGAKEFAGNVAGSAVNKVAAQYPGKGLLWDYDGGFVVKPLGWAALGGVLWLLLGGRR